MTDMYYASTWPLELSIVWLKLPGVDRAREVRWKCLPVHLLHFMGRFVGSQTGVTPSVQSMN